MATLKLEIVTPEALIFQGDVQFVELPGSEGDMGIYPQHELLVTELKAGVVRYTQNGHIETLAIGEGFAEIAATTVGILTEGAVHEKDIDEKVAEEAVHRAEELLKSNTLQAEELEAAQALLARSLVQVGLKRRRRV